MAKSDFDCQHGTHSNIVAYLRKHPVLQQVQQLLRPRPIALLHDAYDPHHRLLQHACIRNHSHRRGAGDAREAARDAAKASRLHQNPAVTDQEQVQLRPAAGGRVHHLLE